MSEPTRPTSPIGRGQAPGPALVRQQRVLLAALLGLAAAGWAVLIWQANRPGMAMGDQEGEMAMAAPSTLDLTAGMSAGLFLAMWVAMMAAMMFPTAAPMVLMFAHVHAGKRRRGQAFVPTWVFTGAYLALWTAFGAVAYLLAEAASTWLGRSTSSSAGRHRARPRWPASAPSLSCWPASTSSPRSSESVCATAARRWRS